MCHITKPRNLVLLLHDRQKGYHVIAPDMPEHGARYEEKLYMNSGTRPNGYILITCAKYGPS